MVLIEISVESSSNQGPPEFRTSQNWLYRFTFSDHAVTFGSASQWPNTMPIKALK